MNKFFKFVVVVLLVVFGFVQNVKAQPDIVAEFDYSFGFNEMVEQYHFGDYATALQFAEPHFYELTAAEQIEVALVWNSYSCGYTFTATYPNGHFVTVSVYTVNCTYAATSSKKHR